MKKLIYFALCCAIASPAFAGVTVSSPYNNESVGSPFTLSAGASSCSSQAVSAMGYSLDNSSSTTIVNSTSIYAKVSSGSGTHTVHVKAWGNRGAVCVTDVAVKVGTSTATPQAVTSGSGPYIPSNATSVSSLEALSSWKGVKDGATNGSASGWTNLVGSPAVSGSSRQFATSYSNNGGERYWTSFADDAYATNFVYDAWVYPAGNAGSVANLEMDLNQVIPNGDTVIYGFQCDGWTNTWDYTGNAGTRTAPKDKWIHSSQYCNPRAWTRNTWHHVQIYYSRNSYGTVTYHTVWLDGKAQTINGTVASAFASGWGKVLLTNFQVDGYGSGSSNIFLDKLTIYRW